MIEEKATWAVLVGLPKREDNDGNFDLAIAHAVCSEGDLIVDGLAVNGHGIQWYKRDGSAWPRIIKVECGTHEVCDQFIDAFQCKWLKIDGVPALVFC